MFCPNCGTNLPDNAEFCTNCGYNLKTGQAPPARPYAPPSGNQPYGQPYYPIAMKSEILAIILAIIIPGTGHMYLGRLTRGLIILVSYIGLSVLAMVIAFSAMPNLFTMDAMDVAFDTGLLVALTILSLISLVIWIVQLIDAYNLTKQYNDSIRQTGQAPW